VVGLVPVENLLGEIGIHFRFGFFGSHLELDVDDVVPVPAEQVLHQDERLVEEVGQQDQREVLVHLGDRLVYVRGIVGAHHIVADVEEHVILRSEKQSLLIFIVKFVYLPEIPVRVSFEVFGGICVECLQSLSSFNISEPLFKWHLILEEAEDGLDVVDGRADDRHVFRLGGHELVQFLFVVAKMMAQDIV
jgi:hypothetical protein